MRNKYFWAALCWTAGIAVSCLISMKNFQDENLDLEHKDKFIHGSFYFGFTVLWYLSARAKNISGFKARALVFTAAVTYGILIEVCQELFTKDRSADVQDAIANSTGSAFAILVIWLFEKIRNK